MSKSRNDYEKLRDKWYAKLKKEGFEDIEVNEAELKEYSASTLRRKRDFNNWQDKAAYYSMATNFLNDYRFASELEKVMWEYHSNAISIRDIVKLLSKAKVAKLNRHDVWVIINKLRKTMMKMYMNGGING